VPQEPKPAEENICPTCDRYRFREQVIEDMPLDVELSSLLRTYAGENDLIPRPLLEMAIKRIEQLPPPGPAEAGEFVKELRDWAKALPESSNDRKGLNKAPARIEFLEKEKADDEKVYLENIDNQYQDIIKLRGRVEQLERENNRLTKRLDMLVTSNSDLAKEVLSTRAKNEQQAEQIAELKKEAEQSDTMGASYKHPLDMD